MKLPRNFSMLEGRRSRDQARCRIHEQ
jgi:hypothetical protein